METSDQRSKQRVETGRPRREREVLRVLWSSADQHLVRSQIYKRLPHSDRPTQGRVGQILAALFKEGMLVRVRRRAQGARKAAFYALSKSGYDLCRRLGFESEERLLFSTTEETLKTYLTPQSLSKRRSGAGRIITVYGWRGRLGRTTLVAYVSRGLAENSDQPILAVDFDLEAPGLNDFFPSQAECRGLGGLLIDVERRLPKKRPLWLRGAVTSPEYVTQPLPENPNLFYMPSGVSPGSASLLPSERAEAVAILRTAAGLQTTSESPVGARTSLKELRSALAQRFHTTLIDSESGRTVGAWTATQILPDQLALCLQMTDTSKLTLDGLRAVLANFLKRPRKENVQRGTMFLFRLTEHSAQSDMNHWIDTHLVQQKSKHKTTTASYVTIRLPYNARIATNRHQWENKHFYKNIISLLSPNLESEQRPTPPEMQALQTILNPAVNEDSRSIAAGILKNASLQEIARWVDWYRREGALPKKTDSKGRELIEEIVKFHARCLRSSITE